MAGCEIAKILGRCPLKIKGALGGKKGDWCHDFKQQAICGNTLSEGVSDGNLQSRSTSVHLNQPSTVLGVHIGRPGKGS